MKTLFSLAATFVVAASFSALAEDDGLATLHDWRREGGRICMSDHFHDGSGSGPTRKAAEVSAISSWASFTTLEYGNHWGSYALAGSRKMNCSQNGVDSWSCDLTARPCKPSRVAARRARIVR
jgi:hypothetical protein